MQLVCRLSLLCKIKTQIHTLHRHMDACVPLYLYTYYIYSISNKITPTSAIPRGTLFLIRSVLLSFGSPMEAPNKEIESSLFKFNHFSFNRNPNPSKQCQCRCVGEL